MKHCLVVDIDIVVCSNRGGVKNGIPLMGLFVC